MAILIDGKKTAQVIKEELKEKIGLLKKDGKPVPGLVTILESIPISIHDLLFEVT